MGHDTGESRNGVSDVPDRQNGHDTRAIADRATLDRRRFLGILGASGVGTMTMGATTGATASARVNRAATATVYLGSYSTWGSPPGRGFEIGTADDATGALSVSGSVGGVADASFFAFSSDGRRIYTTNELPDGTVTALDISDPARPVALGSRSTGGASPTHLSVHPGGRYLFAANYADATVAVLALDEDGRIGEATDLVRQTGTERQAHAHQIVTDPSGQWVVSVDLGADSVYVYALDLDAGTLAPHQQLTLPSGLGPRHIAFHPDGGHAYVLGELRSEITVVAWDSAAGRLEPGQVIGTLGDATPERNNPAEIAVSGDGRFVYASNRGHDSIATFTVGESGGRLDFVNTVPTGGAWPRHFTLAPNGTWLYVANQNSNTVTWLPRDPQTGLLSQFVGSAAVNSVAVVMFH